MATPVAPVLSLGTTTSTTQVLNWTQEEADPPIDAFVLTSREHLIDPFVLVDDGINAGLTTYLVTGLTPGVRYDFVLYAQNGDGSGDDSNMVTTPEESEPEAGDPMTSAFLGRFRRGGRLPLVIVPSASPTACPIVDFWREGTTLVKTVQLPAHDADRTHFALSTFLDAAFLDGHYVATIRYTIGTVTTIHYRYFQVIGGDSRGNVIAVTELRRPLGRAIVAHREDGHISMGYNPRVS